MNPWDALGWALTLLVVLFALSVVIAWADELRNRRRRHGWSKADTDQLAAYRRHWEAER